METTDLGNPRYWEQEGIDIRVNPAVAIDRRGLEEAMRERGIHAAICLATSGSEGRPKMAVLSRQAILYSAGAVNRYCGITENDTWLGGLSTFHVGGIGIYARAFLSGSRVIPMKWNDWSRDGQAFLAACGGDATLTSLTPVHLHDLVSAKIRAPRSLRGVFIGGGALAADLAHRARDLGWPLWTTYGMTEACSQVATSLEGDPVNLPVLPHWEAKTGEDGLLCLRGPALMEGFFRLRPAVSGLWEWTSGRDEDGFYRTSDRVELRHGILTPLGRADRCLKILGEVVSLEKLEQLFALAAQREAIVWAEPDERRGSRLHCAVEGPENEAMRGELMKSNAALPPFERVESFVFREEFPRTLSGKINRRAVSGNRD